MNRELVLAFAALAVVVVAVFAVVLLPGIVSEPADPATEAAVERPGHADIAEVTIAVDEVTGASATLAVDTHLTHRGGPVENVTVVHRATDTNTGLVEDTRELEVGALENESEHVVSGAVTVPRESDYRIETILYENGARTASAEHRVEGVEGLTPAYADTDVSFHRFGSGSGALPAISYSVGSTESADDGGADRVTLDVSASLTNGGDDPEDGLELEVIARQSDSNVVADSTTVDVGSVAPGGTTTPTTELTVPDGYDYSLDALLWRDGTILETSRSAANLGPGNLTIDEAEETGGLEVSDFESTGADGERVNFDAADDVDEDVDDGQPGFGVVAALGTVLAVAVAAVGRRYTHEQ